MRLPAGWFREPVTIATYTGQGAYGDSFADDVTVLGHVASGRGTVGGVRVRSSASGDEVVADQLLILPNPARLADGSGTVDPAEVLLAESRVTVRGVTSTAVHVEPHIQPGTNEVVYVSGALA